MKVKFVNYPKSYKKNKRKYDSAYKKVMESGKLILQDEVTKFEENLAKFLGTKYAVALNSGTDALYLALKAAGVTYGDEVLVPSHTFVATAQVVAQLGATPVLVDMDGEYKITDRTKVLLPAHITGDFQVDMSKVLKDAKKHNLIVIEDACQALGAEQNGKKAGTFGLAGCFSFYPAKILGGWGDGGGLVTNDEKIYEEVKELRNHYKKDYSKWGINSRMDNLQAAFLNIKIKDLPWILKKRKEVADMYLENILFEEFRLLQPVNTKGRVWQDFVIWVSDRDGLYDYLKENGIETMKNEYPFPIQKGEMSIDYESHTLRLPCNENLTKKEVEYVISKVNSWR